MTWKRLDREAPDYDGPLHKKCLQWRDTIARRTKRQGLPKSDLFTSDLYEMAKEVTNCPLLGIKLTWDDGCTYSPTSRTLDRIDPSKGYVKGNVWIISKLANQMKSTATFEQFETMYNNWKDHRFIDERQLSLSL